MRRLIFSLLAVLMLTGCENAVDLLMVDEGNVVLTFQPTSRDMTRSGLDNYFSKLNIQLFDEQGEKVFDKVKTQTKDDDEFGVLSVKLTAGKYWVVAVGHSSKVSATIKSTEAVQFTARDGEKLTDTFCACQQIVVDDETESFTLDMYRVGAMIQFCLEDTDVPKNFAYFKMDYTGGSANFNPQTLEGITKSTQSEKRIRNSLNIHQAYTFPYLAAAGYVKMTCSATDTAGTVIHQRQFDSIPVMRNRITTFHGNFFTEGDGEFSMSDFGFVVHADWDGEQKFSF